jgi:hypothetical protein
MINIPYFKYQNSDGTYSKLPIIPVRLACNKNHQWVYALLDSGADMSLFNASIAKLLNVTVKDGDPISVYGVMDFGIHRLLASGESFRCRSEKCRHKRRVFRR